MNAPIDLQNGGFITGNGYIKSDSNFVITTNSWSRALLKGRVGNYPKLYWGSHPTISQMSSFMIYRKKQTPGFVHIATVSGTSRTYVDSAVTLQAGHQNQTTAEYYIVGVYANGMRQQLLTASTDTINYHRVNGTGLEKDGTDQTERITEYKLEQNYPNPFNPTTTITYQIKEKGFTTLKIYDLLGKLVTTLVNEEKENGKYSVEFNASKLSSGVYLYELRSNEYKSTKKLLLMK
ncbi:MAG: T9SS type A sorting domain-containing protein [Ignavibacteria bacterium]|nr:T9SS type A sorting domain-containing protein [Ignavibacteria bacterium]